jgi:sugar transferase (PEP-CTERM/EpsH1 system associated)
MRIAYLTARYPFPPIGGYRMRVYYTLRHLLRSHEVTLYALDSQVKLNEGSRRPDLPGLQQKIFSMGKAAYAWNGVRGLFSGLPLQVKLYECTDFIQALDAEVRAGAYDLLFVHLVRMAEYVRPYHHLPRVLDMADSIYLHYARMREIWWSPRWLGARVDRSRIQRYEAEAPRWFDSVLIHTQEDLEWVQQQSGTTNVAQSLMGVDTEEYAFQEGPYNPRRIVYCGKLDYLPNTDAALYFANEIFPLVRREVPDAQFAVVGLNPPQSVRALARIPGVEVLANVPDIRPEVSSAAVSVAPIRFGAGIQNKVLQSLAMGVPVVTTPLAAKPFGEPGSSPVLAAETPREFAGQVVRILQDSVYRAQLARAGRRLVETRFEWKQVLAPLDTLLGRLSESKAELFPRIGSV